MPINETVVNIKKKKNNKMKRFIFKSVSIFLSIVLSVAVEMSLVRYGVKIKRRKKKKKNDKVLKL